MDAQDTLLLTEIEFEKDIKRDPYALKYWWRYLLFKHNAEAKVRNQLFERALQYIPASYKIWFAYLQERVHQVKDRPLDNAAWEAVNSTFERALIFMSKMPRIWQEYIRFLMKQYKITSTRHAIDRALQSLPITQHQSIWRSALEFVKQDYVPVDTACRLWKRYLQLEPYLMEDYVIFLRKHKKWNDIINTMIASLNDTKFVSVKGKTRHELWVELCKLLSTQGDALKLDDTNLTVEKIIRTGIKKFPNEVGQLWCALADYNTRCGHFDKARSIYEEGITTVSTVKDFSQIFDSYSHFEEALLSVKMKQLEEGEEEDTTDAYTRAMLKVTHTDFDLAEEVDFRLERLEHLMQRREELLNSVLLRQNPHNVHEWKKRTTIFADDAEKVVKTYTAAVMTVNIAKAIGKPHTLWTGFAKWYEDRGDLKSARSILNKAVEAPFKSVDDLASVWCEFAEMELRNKKYRRALDVLRRATATNFTGPGSWKKVPGQAVQDRLWRSVKLWSLYADVNESICTIRSTKNVYDRAMYLKVATPQIVINFANLMKGNGFWEEAFKVYQQGVSLFQWPLVNDIWLAYISCFVTRFKGKKVERTRDLFEQCVKECPKDKRTQFYLMYARYEERWGLARQCLSVYDRACDKVPEDEVLGMYRRYLKATKKFFGAIKTRDVYEKAIKTLKDKHIPDFCVEYAETERGLGEIERARGLYMHGAQYVDPRKENTFWQSWHAFEINHGNEETFKDMLRVRRSVQSTFSASIDLAAAAETAREERKKRKEEQEEAAGIKQAPREGKYSANPDTDKITFVAQSTAPAGPSEDADAAEAEEIELEERAVPDAVFGDVRKRGAPQDSQLAKRVKLGE